MRGKLAVQHYTGSVVNVLIDALPNLAQKSKINITPSAQSYAQAAGFSNQFPQHHSSSGHGPLFTTGPAKPVLPANKMRNSYANARNISASGN